MILGIEPRASCMTVNYFISELHLQPKMFLNWVVAFLSFYFKRLVCFVVLSFINWTFISYKLSFSLFHRLSLSSLQRDLWSLNMFKYWWNVVWNISLHCMDICLCYWFNKEADWLIAGQKEIGQDSQTRRMLGWRRAESEESSARWRGRKACQKGKCHEPYGRM